jgi:Pyrimidine dimer DNA glycosylase
MIMQVFVPLPDAKMNIKVLTEDMVGPQCAIATTILKTLKGKDKGWQWHPGVKMWVGNDKFLAQYTFRLIDEWKRLGYPDHYTSVVVALGYMKFSMMPVTTPWWWGHGKFHASNQSAMVRQNPDWYGRIFKKANPGMCEWWPLPEEGQFVFGPQPSPMNGNNKYEGRFDYLVDGHPIYNDAKAMLDKEFIRHANQFHNLTPDIKGGIRDNEPTQVLNVLRALHDRFHTQRVYTSHDHK